LRVHQLPAYAPEPNPVEKIWSTMKGSLANLAVRIATDLADRRLRSGMAEGQAPADSECRTRGAVSLAQASAGRRGAQQLAGVQVENIEMAGSILTPTWRPPRLCGQEDAHVQREATGSVDRRSISTASPSSIGDSSDGGAGTVAGRRVYAADDA
jgi:hypothetical protein